jgi:hypothetical protein
MLQLSLANRSCQGIRYYHLVALTLLPFITFIIYHMQQDHGLLTDSAESGEE